MSVDDARKWLIVSSLMITGIQMMFLLLAPAFGYPLEFPQALEVLRIVCPVFLGYLGSASHFIFQNAKSTKQLQNQYIGIILKGSIAVYVLTAGGSLFAFGYTNHSQTDGMSVPELCTALTMSLGVLAVSTGVISSYLFASPMAGRDNPGQNIGHVQGGADAREDIGDA